jgi:hypothetical protein
MLRRTFITSTLSTCAASIAGAVNPPASKDSLRFAVLGDSGTGSRNAFEVGAQLAKARQTFPFDFVIMLGDNLYGSEKPRDYERKFEQPYKELLNSGVKFYASLGNHDDANQRFYKNFNMGGQRFYTFRPRGEIRFFALDSNYLDKSQLEWLERELKASGSEWKICFFHHPIYSSGERHGPSLQLRAILEPLFVEHSIDVVFQGHEHFYERIKPQRDIYYFIVGSSAKLREGNISRTEITAKGFDTDNVFTLAEIAGDQMHFQTLSRTGKQVDAGTIQRKKK